MKFSLSQPQSAIYRFSDCGSIFGGGNGKTCNICVANNSDSNTGSYPFLGNCHRYYTGKGGQMFFTGVSAFRVKEIEEMFFLFVKNFVLSFEFALRSVLQCGPDRETKKSLKIVSFRHQSFIEERQKIESFRLFRKDFVNTCPLQNEIDRIFLERQNSFKASSRSNCR
jgi:hypothetical protein